MKPKRPVAFISGMVLFILGVISLMSTKNPGSSFIPFLIGASLVYLGWRGGRAALVIFGHTCIILGAFLITWGVYLLPSFKPVFSHIVGGPLFWGFISMMGGVCANYHGFCNCVRKWE